ncbi:MAG: outer membrane protein assembly factor BamE [Candidatus Thiodiazotropha taylori]
MKKLKLITSMLIVALIAGCAAGVNFKKMEENQLVLGKTTKQDVLTFMGKANGKGANTFNGIELDVLNYAYAKVGGGSALPGVTPARSQGLLFRDGVLVGKEYTSSFSSDSTLFDTDKAKTIIKGQTKEDVVFIMGLPKGEYLYPIIDDESGYAYVYMFSQTKGFKTRTDLFVVEFNKDNIVTKTKLSSTGQL